MTDPNLELLRDLDNVLSNAFSRGLSGNEISAAVYWAQSREHSRRAGLLTDGHGHAIRCNVFIVGNDQDERDCNCGFSAEKQKAAAAESQVVIDACIEAFFGAVPEHYSGPLRESMKRTLARYEELRAGYPRDGEPSFEKSIGGGGVPDYSTIGSKVHRRTVPYHAESDRETEANN